MVKIRKNKTTEIYFVFFLTLFLFYGCSSSKKSVSDVVASQICVNDSFTTNSKIENYIAPYRNHIDKDLDSILAYNPITQDKSKGKWETNIGNLFASTVFNVIQPIFEAREKHKLNACLLNHGGIRSIIPQGNVTTRTAYEIMPFENSVFVVGLNGKEIEDLANYLISEKKPHPLYGITIYVDKQEKKVGKIEIDGKALEQNKVYYIATSDYLANGGDNMDFFKKSVIKYDLDYKIRNIFIDYFKKIDTIPNITTQHIIIE